MSGILRRCSAALFAVTLALLLAPGFGEGVLAQREQQRPAEESRAERSRLEMQVQARLADIARRELSLTDAQFARLQDVNARFEQRRMANMQAERSTRFQLRRELQRGNRPNEARVSALLDSLLMAQRQRVVILEDEQRELSSFLTAVQRARYAGLQESFRRRVESQREATPRRRPPDA